MSYLQPVSERSRRVSVIALRIVAGIGGVASAFICVDMFNRHSLEFEGKPIWMAAIVVAVISAAATWISCRLSHNTLSANDVTVIPPWFLRVFGIFMLTTSCVIVVQFRKPL